MRTRLAMVAVLLLVLVLATGSSYAVTAGTLNPTLGIKIYSQAAPNSYSSGVIDNFTFYSTTVDPGWALSNRNTLEDVLDWAPWSSGWSGSQLAGWYNGRATEVLTTSADRWTGVATGDAVKLVVAAHTTYGFGDSTQVDMPMDIVGVTPNSGNPTNAANFYSLSPGSLSGDWRSGRTYLVMRAPDGLGGKTSNGRSLWIGTCDQGAYYLHDANGNTIIDNGTAGEGVAMGANGGGDGYAGSDQEWGPDSALYQSFGNTVYRNYLDGSGTKVQQTYANLTTLKSTYTWIDGATGCSGLAIAPDPQGGAPLVYMAAMTTTTDPDCSDVTQRVTILGFKDTNGDNVIDLSDAAPIIVWRNGWFGAGVGFYDATLLNVDGEMMDLEWDPVSDSIISTNTWSSIYAISLDNTTNSSAIGITNFDLNWNRQGTGDAPIQGPYFELDVTGIEGGAVPEPATLLLMGTGAIGVIGYIRRRRMI